ncbi:hypothetical protein BT67DRAFT_60243 [Trichocladium antarcticum]|uniref:Uncharacterized protein n=1 Tax=Trichocladium antarcticum TaxID=1450529 RepID=A0AAN6ZCY3_9PEZI|nr:hypothetical protein BT67DRAFT_60243 [Trichocladium antarcticum]
MVLMAEMTVAAPEPFESRAAPGQEQGEQSAEPGPQPRHEAQQHEQTPRQAHAQHTHRTGTDYCPPGPGLPSPLPLAFPKKRRGRPPGRPNMTVRETDYEDNPLVQAWNAAKGERAVAVVSIGIRDALTEQSLVHETQKAIFRLHSRETIHFVQGWITARHIASQRPSYVNGLLIHSRGQDATVSCAQCTERRDKHALGPFLTCRVLPGSYHNSCSNCKWFDNTSACSLYTGPKPNRKRKAKEQLPPPPPPTPPPPPPLDTADGGIISSPATTPTEDRPHQSVSEGQTLAQQEQPDLHPPTDPRLQEAQPEPDMAPLQDSHQEEPTAEHMPDPTDDNPPDPCPHSPAIEPSNSDVSQAPCQTD